MKKKFIVLFMLVGVLVLTGCTKTTVCNITVNQSAYTLKSEYKISYDGKYVKKVETVEEVTSSDEDVLNQFKQVLDQQLSPYQDLKYYDFTVNVTDEKLTEKITIDYTKLDIDKFLQINSDAASMLENKKVKYDSVISLYNQLGATCK